MAQHSANLQTLREQWTMEKPVIDTALSTAASKASMSVARIPLIQDLVHRLNSLMSGIGGFGGGGGWGGCFEWVEPLLFDSTGDCTGNPNNPRMLGARVFMFGGEPHLVMNNGNGLSGWRISSPTSPHLEFYMKNLTRGYLSERDYNMFSFSVCDEGRYGVAAFPSFGVWSSDMGFTLIDFGTGTSPRVVDWRQHPVESLSLNAGGEGAFTFKRGDQQYLLVKGIEYDVPRPTASLYAMNGVRLEDLTWLQDVYLPGADPWEKMLDVANGVDVDDSTLYIFGNDGDGHIYSVDGSGLSLRLTYVRSPFWAGFTQCHGVRINKTRNIMASATGSMVWLWDISSPQLPVALSSWEPDAGHQITSIALAEDKLWVGRKGSSGAAWTYDITDPENPAALDQGFWDLGNAWNSISPCEYEYDAVFSPTGEALYLARYSVAMVIYAAPLDVEEEPVGEGAPVIEEAELVGGGVPGYPSQAMGMMEDGVVTAPLVTIDPSSVFAGIKLALTHVQAAATLGGTIHNTVISLADEADNLGNAVTDRATMISNKAATFTPSQWTNAVPLGIGYTGGWNLHDELLGVVSTVHLGFPGVDALIGTVNQKVSSIVGFVESLNTSVRAFRATVAGMRSAAHSVATGVDGIKTLANIVDLFLVNILNFSASMSFDLGSIKKLFEFVLLLALVGQIIIILKALIDELEELEMIANNIAAMGEHAQDSMDGITRRLGVPF